MQALYDVDGVIRNHQHHNGKSKGKGQVDELNVSGISLGLDEDQEDEITESIKGGSTGKKNKLKGLKNSKGRKNDNTTEEHNDSD